MTEQPGAGHESTAPKAPGPAASANFQVTLENFNGPFEVLVEMLSRRDLDITEVALAEVTDEFVAYLRTLADEIGATVLEETTEFLVVASTLLDMKAARLLPQGEVEDAEDIERLEARDLLFARLLQYKAYKEAATVLEHLLEAGSRFVPRQVRADDPDVREHLPELEWTHTPEQFAAIAAKALARKHTAEPDEVGTDHIHDAPVSVAEQAQQIAARLRAAKALTFSELTADAEASLVVVARFLALLEMYRDRAVDLEQESPLTEIMVEWIATGSGEFRVAEYDGDEGETSEENPAEEAASQGGTA